MKQIIVIIALIIALFPPIVMKSDSLITSFVSSNIETNQVYDELVELNEQAELNTYDLITTRNRLNQINQEIENLNEQIAQASEQLTQAKEQLAVFIKSTYTNRIQSFYEVILGSTSFDDFTSRITYIEKIIETKNLLLREIEMTRYNLMQQKVQLETKKKELKQLIQQQAYVIQSTEEAVTNIQNYADNMTEEEKQEVNQYAQETNIETIEQSQEDLEWLQISTNPNSENAEDINQAIEQTTEYLEEIKNEEQIPETTLIQEVDFNINEILNSEIPVEENIVNEIDDSHPDIYMSDFLSRAYSTLGAGYQWSGYNWTGDIADSAFTCSGVVDYALGRATNSSSPESLYNEIGDNITTDVSSFQAGDLVFYSYGDRAIGHVGIYVGNNQVLDSIPNGGVALRDVDYMDVVGGGTLYY